MKNNSRKLVKVRVNDITSLFPKSDWRRSTKGKKEDDASYVAYIISQLPPDFPEGSLTDGHSTNGGWKFKRALQGSLPNCFVSRSSLDIIAKFRNYKNWDDYIAAKHHLLGIWKIYYVKKDVVNAYCIVEYILSCNNLGEVVLQSSHGSYNGKIQSNSSTGNHPIIVFDTKTDSDKSTVTHRSLHLHIVSNANYAEGIMVSTSRNGGLYSNIILLRKCDKTQKVKPAVYYYRQKDLDLGKLKLKFLDTNALLINDLRNDNNGNLQRREGNAIIEYFRYVHINRSKTGEFPLSSLKSFEDIIPSKNNLDFPYRYECYISTPFSSIEKGGLLTKEEVLKLTDLLSTKIASVMNWDRERDVISMIQFKDKHNDPVLDRSYTPEDSIRNFNHSKRFVLFLPLEVVGGPLVESSWTFNSFSCKNTLFIVDENAWSNYFPQSFFSRIDATKVKKIPSGDFKHWKNIIERIDESELRKILN